MLSAVLAGAFSFPLLFCCVRQTLKSSVTGWSDADTACVSERVVSAFHGSLATAAGVVVVTSCKDVMTDSHWLVNGFVCFGAPYMTFDLYAMYLSHFYSQSAAHKGHSLKSLRAFLLKDWMLVLHHTALLLVFMPITLFFRRGLGDFFIGCLFLTEFSTPFIAIGKILIQRGLQNTRLFRVNGIVVLLNFFTCRILLFPFMYWSTHYPSVWALVGLWALRIVITFPPYTTPLVTHIGCVRRGVELELLEPAEPVSKVRFSAMTT